MRQMVAVAVLLFVFVSGCSQFSTQPPDIPRILNITNEQFEQAYMLRMRGTPTTIRMDYDHADYYLELWFYPEQNAVVMFIIEGDKYRVQTYHYGVVR